MAIFKTEALCGVTLVAVLGSMPANADDVSKSAGICLALKLALKKEAEADQAVHTVPNPLLALSHGREWIREMQENPKHQYSLFGDATRVSQDRAPEQLSSKSR